MIWNKEEYVCPSKGNDIRSRLQLEVSSTSIKEITWPSLPRITRLSFSGPITQCSVSQFANRKLSVEFNKKQLTYSNVTLRITRNMTINSTRVNTADARFRSPKEWSILESASYKGYREAIVAVGQSIEGRTKPSRRVCLQTWVSQPYWCQAWCSNWGLLVDSAKEPEPNILQQYHVIRMAWIIQYWVTDSILFVQVYYCIRFSLFRACFVL